MLHTVNVFIQQQGMNTKVTKREAYKDDGQQTSYY